MLFSFQVHQTRIETFLERENELKGANDKLRQTIISMERTSHDAVAANLRRFDQYKV